MKINKCIILIFLVLFTFFVSTCSAPDTKQSEDQSTVQSTDQSDETSKITENPNYGYTAPPVSASYFWKLYKAASNLSWAAAARMAIISQKYPDNHNIVNEAWQGDMSAKFYRGNRDAKPYDYSEMIDVIRKAMEYYGTGGTWRSKVVPNADDVYSNEFYRVLEARIPIIIVRRENANYNHYWAIVIYAMPDATDNREKISVWDPEHGWNYTCDLKSFCNDSRYNNGGQYAIYYKWGPGGYIPDPNN